jgi:hypothetical protein
MHCASPQMSVGQADEVTLHASLMHFASIALPLFAHKS